MRSIIIACLSTIIALLGVSSAQAVERKELLCIPSAVEQPVKSTNASGTCPSGFSVAHVLGGAAEEHLKYVAEGVAKKPTWEVNGASIVLKKGAGAAGTGNLVVGQAPLKAGETVGSNNVVIGQENTASSEESLIVGNKDKSNNFWQLVQGERNSSGALAAGIFGGESNLASGSNSVICGGKEQTTTELLQNLC